MYVEWVTPFPLASQHNRDRLQPLQRQLLRFAQVGTVQLPMPPAIGFPVLAASPAARPLFASSESSVFTAVGEGGGTAQPDIPV